MHRVFFHMAPIISHLVHHGSLLPGFPASLLPTSTPKSTLNRQPKGVHEHLSQNPSLLCSQLPHGSHLTQNKATILSTAYHPLRDPAPINSLLSPPATLLLGGFLSSLPEYSFPVRNHRSHLLLPCFLIYTSLKIFCIGDTTDYPIMLIHGGVGMCVCAGPHWPCDLGRSPLLPEFMLPMDKNRIK